MVTPMKDPSEKIQHCVIVTGERFECSFINHYVGKDLFFLTKNQSPGIY